MRLMNFGQACNMKTINSITEKHRLLALPDPLLLNYSKRLHGDFMLRRKINPIYCIFLKKKK